MSRKPEKAPFWLVLFACLFALAFFSSPAQAQVGKEPRPLITQNVDESKLVTLGGNKRAEAKADNDRGIVPNDFQMDHMLLQLRRAPEQEEALKLFIDELHDSQSPNFQQWLNAEEFGSRFGLAQQDLGIVTHWLESYGFRINVVYPSRILIDFSGSAGQVFRAFHTEIHRLQVNGADHVANMSEPQIPSAIAPAIVGIVSLHDFRPRPQVKLHREYTSGSGVYALVPGDLATIYNFNPLFNSGVSGQGQTIALVEDTNLYSTGDWSTFRSTFGLSKYSAGSLTESHPAPPSGSNNCSDPGVNADDVEAILDAEYASAAAPSAAIQMASCLDTATTFGGLIALQNLINGNNPPAIVSVSYGECETMNGAAANAAYNSTYQQAVAEGVSVYVAAGDSGAAACDQNQAAASYGITVSGFASTPYNVAVGGTDFSDTYSGTNSTYWDSSNSSNYSSARSYLPEIPWNDSCTGALLASHEGYSTSGPNSLCNIAGGILSALLGMTTTAAGGGGPSGCASGTPSINGVVSGSCRGYAKPSWQVVPGNPGDGVRDIPDVSLFAANGLWSHYYVFCYSDTVNGGTACTGAPSGWTGAGGTSFGSPIMAGVQALVNQKTGAHQGNPNPTLYSLAAKAYGSGSNSSCNSSLGNSVGNSCVFYDVTLGDMSVDCTGSQNCFDSADGYGVLSTSNAVDNPAYGTKTGWDFATGIGSVNVANLVNNWPTSSTTPSFTLSVSSSAVTLNQGSSGTSTVTVIPQNGFNGNVTLSASGMPSGVTATFVPSSTTSTSTLMLTASSTATKGTANVAITGTSGSLTSTTTLSLTVNSAPVPNFSLSASPSTLTVTQGASGTSTIKVNPLNGFNGSVNLTASGLPSGVTASFSPTSATSTSTLMLTTSSTATTGPASVGITGTSGSLTSTTTLSLAVQAVTKLPAMWTDADVGATGVAGSATYANGTFTVNGAGTSAWGTADGINFVYQSLSGNGTIVARVLSVSGSSTGGVMIRDTLNANAMSMFVAYYSSRIYSNYRTSTGGNTSQGSSGLVSLPYWVKLVRSGSTFSSYFSPDGVNWQLETNQTINMGQNVYIGLGVSSGSTSSLATATFDNVTVTAP